jgi:hypothetical protein
VKQKTANAQHLRIVRSPPPEVVEADPQGVLFPLGPEGTLGLIDLSQIDGNRLVDILRELQPRWVIDLRAVPKFDFGASSRRSVLGQIQRLGSSYLDIGGLLGITSRRHSVISTGEAVEALNAAIGVQCRSSSAGTLLILLDSPEAVKASANLLPRMLKPRPRGGWRVYLIQE